jgi:hypothetical protein
MRGLLKGPFAKTHPLSAVGDAVVHGVEERSRRVVVPGWLRLMLAARGLLGPLADRQWREHAAEADAMTQAEVARRGVEAASAPVGAGGEADERASGRGVSAS